MTDDNINSHLRKIAKFRYNGISDADIANVLHLTADEFSKLLESPEYKAISSEFQLETQEANIDIDADWDHVEREALGILKTTMEWNRDPETALKVAAIANKAQRRHRGNNALHSADLGARKVINLHQFFVGQINNNQNNRAQKITLNPTDAKHNSFASAERIGEMFSIADTDTTGQDVEISDYPQLDNFKVAE